MIIIVPDVVDGIAALVKGLADYTIEDIKQKMSFGAIEIHLPKFKMESTLSLDDPLKQVTFSSLTPQIF